MSPKEKAADYITYIAHKIYCISNEYLKRISTVKVCSIQRICLCSNSRSGARDILSLNT